MLPTRLIAIPLKQEVAGRRRQKARSNRDRHCSPGEDALELLENLSKHCRYDKRKRDNALKKWDRLIDGAVKLTRMLLAGQQ